MKLLDKLIRFATMCIYGFFVVLVIVILYLVAAR